MSIAPKSSVAARPERHGSVQTPRKVLSQMSFGSRTTIRLIEAAKAVQQWRDQGPNGILTHTHACGGLNEAMIPRNPQDRTMEGLGQYWNCRSG
jgi:hypothetical protein